MQMNMVFQGWTSIRRWLKWKTLLEVLSSFIHNSLVTFDESGLILTKDDLCGLRGIHEDDIVLVCYILCIIHCSTVVNRLFSFNVGLLTIFQMFF